MKYLFFIIAVISFVQILLAVATGKMSMFTSLGGWIVVFILCLKGKNQVDLIEILKNRLGE